MTHSTAPVALRVPHERTHHGDTFIDQYEWLREKDDPRVIAHLNAENVFADEQTAHLEELRDHIFGEIKAHTQETDLSVPSRRGAWWYYSRSFEGKQYATHARAPITDDSDWSPPVIAGAPADQPALPGEEILLDGNVEAEGHDFFSLGSFDISADGALLAYATDTVGDERFTLRIRDLTTGADLADEVPGTAHGATFSPDGRFVFYTTIDDAWRPDTVWRHAVGTAANADARVLSEPDERFWTGVGSTRSRRFLLAEIGSNITTEFRLLDAADPTGEFRVVWPRRDGVEYSVEHAVIGGEDRLLVLHNDGAENFELVDVSADDPLGERRTVLAHDPAIRLESVDAFSDHLVVEYRRDALSRLGIMRLTAEGYGPLEELAFDEPLYTVGAGGNPEWTQPTVRLGYGSLATPSSVYDYDVATGERRLLKQQAVLGQYDSALYRQEREWATGPDGTRVPISLVYRSDLVTPGTPAPLELYGYGSYESSIDPAFSIARLSLLDRGVVYAIAHVRGGGELGRSWYESGKTLTKKNTFVDFVAAAEHLIATGWTTSNRMVAEGRSAGGLLMGAVANLAPQSF
ncbi:MAG: S9 family peptidase, partial [Microbacteriaceae bacterium]